MAEVNAVTILELKVGFTVRIRVTSVRNRVSILRITAFLRILID